jgi:hypothetical protein
MRPLQEFPLADPDHFSELNFHDSSIERRFYTRIAPKPFVHLLLGSKVMGTLIDISENGLLVSTPHELSINSVHRIIVPLTGMPRAIRVNARTIWADASQNRFGIQLLDLSEEDRQRFRDWVVFQAEQTPDRCNQNSFATSSQQGSSPQTFDVSSGPPTPDAPVEQISHLPSSDVSSEIPPPEANTRVDDNVAFEFELPSTPVLVFLAIALAVACTAAGWAIRHSASSKYVNHTAIHGSISSPAKRAPSTATAVGRAVMDSPAPATSPESLTTPSDIYIGSNRAVRGRQSHSASDSSDGTSSANLTAETDASHGPYPAPKPKWSGSRGRSRSTNSVPLSSSRISSTSWSSTPAVQPETSAPFSNAIVNSTNGNSPNSAAASYSSQVNRNMGDNDLFPDANATLSPGANSTVPTTPSKSVPRQPTSSDSATRTSGVVRNSVRSMSGATTRAERSIISTEPRVTELPAPEFASFINLPGEHLVQSPAVTIHVRRAVWVRGHHWFWRGHKKVAVGQLAFCVDPQLPRSDRNGTLTVQAIIDKDGRVTRLRPLYGSLAFLPLVSSAVHEWRYEPTYLDSKPVETMARIEVDFHSPAHTYRP